MRHYSISVLIFAVLFLLPGPGLSSLALPDDTSGASIGALQDYPHIGKRSSELSSWLFGHVAAPARWLPALRGEDLRKETLADASDQHVLIKSIRAPPLSLRV